VLLCLSSRDRIPIVELSLRARIFLARNDNNSAWKICIAVRSLEYLSRTMPANNDATRHILRLLCPPADGRSRNCASAYNYFRRKRNKRRKYTRALPNSVIRYLRPCTSTRVWFRVRRRLNFLSILHNSYK